MTKKSKLNHNPVPNHIPDHAFLQCKFGVNHSHIEFQRVQMTQIFKFFS